MKNITFEARTEVIIKKDSLDINFKVKGIEEPVDCRNLDGCIVMALALSGLEQHCAANKINFLESISDYLHGKQRFVKFEMGEA